MTINTTPPILRGMDAIDSCTRKDQLQAARRYSELAFERTGENLSAAVRGVFREMTSAKLQAAYRRLRGQAWPPPPETAMQLKARETIAA